MRRRGQVCAAGASAVSDGVTRPTSRSVVEPVAWTLLGVCLVWFAAGTITRTPGQASYWHDLVLYNGVYAAAGLLCLCPAAGVGHERLAWRLVGAALLVTLAANVVYTLVVTPAADPPYPSAADALYLLFYPFLYAALALMARVRVPRFHRSMGLDGVVGGLGAGAVVLALALGPLLELGDGDGDGDDGVAVVLTNLAYPVADLLLLVLLVATAAVLGMRADRALLALGAGLLLTLVADIGFLVADSAGTYVEGGLLDVVWLLAVAAMAAGAGSRGAPARAVADPDASTRIGWRVLAVPGASFTASLVLLASGWGDAMPRIAGVFAVACALAAGVRAVLTFREVRDLPEARRLARTDELTGLANRRALYERCDRALADRSLHPVALLLLDLDGFKHVNDTFGHQAGDGLLVQVADRLAPLLRPEDLLTRLGGDEFAVLLPRTGQDDAALVAAGLQEQLATSFTIDTVRLHVRGSIGVACGPHPAASRSELMRCADVAMYQAKTSQGDVAVFVDDAEGGERLRTAEELREALDRGELLVHLQPQLDLGSGDVVGVEALVRWQHPRRGLLLPGAFLQHVDWAGLQRPLADAVVDLSLAAASRWWTEEAPVPVSVNLSPANVSDLELPTKLAAAARRHGLPLSAITVELTEHSLMTEPARARDVLLLLRQRGVGVSIDDYGTGYSSLSYLRHLPADELKLDRSLSLDVTTSGRAASIVRHTVALAHDLGLRVVAEGIEDDATARALHALGCDTGQGYRLALPMPVDEFVAWLHRRHAGQDAGRDGRTARPTATAAG